jgi:O-antigen/teichoic acid export membrane protein
LGEAIVPILKGLGQPYKVTILEAVQSFFLIALVWGLASRYGLIGAVLAWLPATVVSQGISGVFASQILHKPFRELKGPMFAILSASGVGGLVAFGVASKLEGLFGFVAATLIALMVIGTLLWTSDRQFELGLARGLARVFPQFATLVGFSPAES